VRSAEVYTVSSLSGSFDSTRERSRTTVAAQLHSYRFI
jgi:hypothetical protein